LNIFGFGITGDFSQTNDCPLTLNPGATCTTTVTFAPKATGQQAASINVSTNAPSSPDSTLLTGTGTQAQMSPSGSLTFAPQFVETQSGILYESIRSTGTATLKVGALSLTGANMSDFSIAESGCALVMPGNSCRIGIKFKPSLEGARVASLVIPSNAPDSPATISIAGIGKRHPTKMKASAAYSITPLQTTKVVINPRGTLTDGDSGGPVQGKLLDFYANLQPLCSGVTDASGTASCTASIIGHLQEALTSGYTATFSGDAAYQGSSVKAPLVCVGNTCLP
jgi:hypothetical protein